MEIVDIIGRKYEATLKKLKIGRNGREESAKQLTKKVFNYRITVYKWVIVACLIR